MAETSNADILKPWTISTVVAMTALAVVSVGLRLLARHERKQKLWWDDGLILFSMAWNIIVDGLIAMMLQNGMGLHADTVPLEELSTLLKLLMIAETFYVSNLAWTKLSILMMYYRIFPLRIFKRCAYVIGAFVISSTIIVVFLFVFLCDPVASQWDFNLPRHCISNVHVGIANSASTMFSDLAILALPVPHIWKLQLQKVEKILLTFIFGLGLFVVFASAYRLKVMLTYDPNDASYSLAPIVGWTQIEMAAGIVSACLPTIRPPLVRFSRSLGLRQLFNVLRSSHSFSPTISDTAPGIIVITTNNNINNNSQKKATSSQRAFYRLPDEPDHRALKDVPYDATLPDHAYVNSVSRGTDGDGDTSATDDEIPLENIRVKTDFTLVQG